jgi:glycine C-acetyltransferase
MNEELEYRGGENFDLRKMLVRGRSLRLQERVGVFAGFMEHLHSNGENLCLRMVTSPSGREVDVLDPVTGHTTRMLMFGSNNYLGLADHPVVKSRIEDAVRAYGAGVAGPPLLNGYTSLHRLLEERLAALKGSESALLFSSGYVANVGLVSGLLQPGDVMLYDSYSHASFCDGLTMSGARSFRFSHNDLGSLTRLLERNTAPAHDTYVGVEGVYSMDGDLAPLDRIAALCERHGAILILDDAHGTGVMGPTGRGTAEHFGVEGRVPITMGTFSKTFSVTGAFVAASNAVVNFLRYFARSYMFSASLPPAVVGAVLGGLDVLERESERLSLLRDNVALLAEGLRRLGIAARPEAAIVPIIVPGWMNIRAAAKEFHRRGLFVNSVEYPAVPVSQQRFRISLMATHTREDISRLLTAVEEIWADFSHAADPSASPSLAA